LQNPTEAMAVWCNIEACLESLCSFDAAVGRNLTVLALIMRRSTVGDRPQASHRAVSTIPIVRVGGVWLFRGAIKCQEEC
jgi:hypothetical protein